MSIPDIEEVLLRKRMEEIGDAIDRVREEVVQFAVPAATGRERALVLTKLDEAKLWFDRLVEEWPRCPKCDGIGRFDVERGGSFVDCDACHGDGYSRERPGPDRLIR